MIMIRCSSRQPVRGHCVGSLHILVKPNQLMIYYSLPLNSNVNKKMVYIILVISVNSQYYNDNAVNEQLQLLGDCYYNKLLIMNYSAKLKHSRPANMFPWETTDHERDLCV